MLSAPFLGGADVESNLAPAPGKPGTTPPVVGGVGAAALGCCARLLVNVMLYGPAPDCE
jgi:hypothetical protein